jgi:hypothetical protein
MNPKEGSHPNIPEQQRKVEIAKSFRDILNKVTTLEKQRKNSTGFIPLLDQNDFSMEIAPFEFKYVSRSNGIYPPNFSIRAYDAKLGETVVTSFSVGKDQHIIRESGAMAGIGGHRMGLSQRVAERPLSLKESEFLVNVMRSPHLTSTKEIKSLISLTLEEQAKARKIIDPLNEKEADMADTLLEMAHRRRIPLHSRHPRPLA